MTQTFQTKKSQLETYFDRTASKAWQQLTSTANLIRQGCVEAQVTIKVLLIVPKARRRR